MIACYRALAIIIELADGYWAWQLSQSLLISEPAYSCYIAELQALIQDKSCRHFSR